MKNNILTIGGTKIHPGERITLSLPMPKLYDWTPLTMPVHVIRGEKPGPVLCVTAAVHGDEVNGVEIVRRLLKKPFLKKIAGTLIAIPIVNVYGFLNQDRYLMDRRDLNRCFPGSQKGSLASRLAHLLSTEILSKITHQIDLHTGSLYRSNLPQIRADVDHKETRHMAKYFNAPVILHSALRPGSLRHYASSLSIPFLLFEAGESLRFDEFSIKSGIKGITNVMGALKMLPKDKMPDIKFSSQLARSSFWVRSPYSGILRFYKTLGKKVKKGDLLAVISNPTGPEEYKLLSPLSGIIIGKSNLPTVYEGAALFHIACFEKVEAVANRVEYLQGLYGDGNDDEKLL
ncbi:MAG: succinylglutamate desuccinylase/aspartoacylase family protein [Coxiellaceae bacterium]|nr:succinylglutamate desuccinylase/aspartoacylase family protein [Coxiellaceae bacterium]